jgi:hypothetical protein
MKIKFLILMTSVGIAGIGAGFLAEKLHAPRTDPYAFLTPKLPISQPFAMDKAGNKARIDFWAVPGQVVLGDLDVGYMVAVTFSRRDTQENLIDLIQQGERFQDGREPVALKVKVFLVKNSDEVPIATWDYSSARAALGDSQYHMPTQEKTEQSMVYLHTNSWSSDWLLTVAAGFHLPEYGHYRVEVETVENQPVFKSVGATLIVDKYSYAGK